MSARRMRPTHTCFTPTHQERGRDTCLHPAGHWGRSEVGQHRHFSPGEGLGATLARLLERRKGGQRHGAVAWGIGWADEALRGRGAVVGGPGWRSAQPQNVAGEGRECLEARHHARVLADHLAPHGVLLRASAMPTFDLRAAGVGTGGEDRVELVGGRGKAPRCEPPWCGPRRPRPRRPAGPGHGHPPLPSLGSCRRSRPSSGSGSPGSPSWFGSVPQNQRRRPCFSPSATAPRHPE